MNKVLLIYAPNSYWFASQKQRDEVCNGCGSKGGTKVPSRFFGLSIKRACNVHDWMYEEGETYADFLFANAMFLLNLTLIIIKGSNWFSILPRLWLATKYFIAVSLKGHDAYWSKKTVNEKMYITYKGNFR